MLSDSSLGVSALARLCQCPGQTVYCSAAGSDIDLVCYADTEHTFSQAGQDWGFQTFLSLAELRRPENGFLDSEDNFCIRVTVKVCILKQERLLT